MCASFSIWTKRNSMTSPVHSPLIFIHYGDASYLRFTLETARRSNPDKRIILLGDESNRKLVPRGVEHHLLETYARGERIAIFDRVFQLIKGEEHNYRKLGGADFWTRFVFRRWFIIREFLEAEGIGSFWTFDSDTLILAPLTPREPRFAEFACTEQCRAQCLNGFVADPTLPSRYVDKINELFQRSDYLEAQRVLLRRHTGLAYTEMSAYVTFREESDFRSYHAAVPLEGETFDDALCFTENFAIHPEKVKGRMTIKELRLDPRGAVWSRTETGEVVRMVTINGSWMPDYIFHRLGALATTQEITKISPAEYERLTLLDVSEPLSSKMNRELQMAVSRASGFVRRFMKPGKSKSAAG